MEARVGATRPREKHASKPAKTERLRRPRVESAHFGFFRAFPALFFAAFERGSFLEKGSFVRARNATRKTVRLCETFDWNSRERLTSRCLTVHTVKHDLIQGLDDFVLERTQVERIQMSILFHFLLLHTSDVFSVYGKHRVRRLKA